MSYKGATVFFVCILTFFTYADHSCTYSVLEGGNVMIDTFMSQEYPTVTWKKNKEIIAQMKRTKITRGDIYGNGSLLLKNVKMDSAGKYIVEVSTDDGKSTETTVELCVYAKVPKPKVNFTCEQNQVAFICDVNGDANLEVTWYKNGQIINKHLRNFKTNITDKDPMFKCTVNNQADSSTSEEVKVNCPKQASNTLFGFDFWIMVGILAGGGALVLLLMVVLLTCACRSCKRQVKMQQDEEEFRLNNLHTSQPSGQPKSKQTARGQPAPPIPHDEVSISEMSEAPTKAQARPRNQRCVRPPPPPIDEDEQPPPLPQPRKQPHTKI